MDHKTFTGKYRLPVQLRVFLSCIGIGANTGRLARTAFSMEFHGVGAHAGVSMSLWNTITTDGLGCTVVRSECA
jgi:hypothetical protein